MDEPLLPALPGYEDPILIAHGTTALVFRAIQTTLGRPVAIKVLMADTSAVPVNVDRELATTVALSSQPHIVSIIDTGETSDGRRFIVMEYCEGGSYAQILRSGGPLPVDDVIEVGIKIGEALHAAHEVGIVHRDVKPSNILRSRFGPALTDFGIARAPDELGGTATVEMMTPHHASPEALLHQAQSGPSDIYSLASTLWTLLVGHPPFVDPTRPPLDIYSFRDKVLHDPLPTMTRDDVPPWLTAELTKAMSKLPSHRHATALEFADALQRGNLGLSPSYIPPVAVPVPGVAVPVPPRPTVAPVAPEPQLPAAGPAHAPAPSSPTAPGPSAAGDDDLIYRPARSGGDSGRHHIDLDAIEEEDDRWFGPVPDAPVVATSRPVPVPSSGAVPPPPIPRDAVPPPPPVPSVPPPPPPSAPVSPAPGVPVSTASAVAAAVPVAAFAEVATPPLALAEPVVAAPAARSSGFATRSAESTARSGDSTARSGGSREPDFEHDPARDEGRNPLTRPRPRRGGLIVLLAGLIVIGLAAYALHDLKNRPINPNWTVNPSALPSNMVYGHPEGAPTQVRIAEDDGTAVTLVWQDPAAGQGVVVVAQLRPDDVQATAKSYVLPGGTHSLTATELDPTLNYCFVVAVIYSPDDVGRADPVCTARHS